MAKKISTRWQKHKFLLIPRLRRFLKKRWLFLAIIMAFFLIVHLLIAFFLIENLFDLLDHDPLVHETNDQENVSMKPLKTVDVKPEDHLVHETNDQENVSMKPLKTINVKPEYQTNTLEEQQTGSLQAPLQVVSTKPTKKIPLIPHTLFFTYGTNILETKKPKLYYDNVKHTIDMYSQYWLPGSTRVRFLTDDDCRVIINSTEARLVPYFDKEPQGKYKADICRVAALYKEGGYYFDIDIEVIKVFDLGEISFSTVHEADKSGGFFQAFLAADKSHPILKEALSKMLVYYGKYTKPATYMGVTTLKEAFNSVPISLRGSVLLLKEFNLDTLSVNNYTDLKLRRPLGSLGCCCNYVVSDSQGVHVYFWSRIVGSVFC